MKTIWNSRENTLLGSSLCAAWSDRSAVLQRIRNSQISSRRISLTLVPTRFVHLCQSQTSHILVFLTSVSALPTSSSRWERLSFPTLVKRWDLVGLLELMTKRSTGLPSRWIEGSQLSLRPLSTDVCFPLCGLRGFSAAKTNYVIELCVRFMCMYKVYLMVFAPYCNGACSLFKLGKLLIHLLFDRTRTISSVYYYSWHLKVTLILMKRKL